MTGRDVTLNFAVGSRDGPRSSVWRLWANKNGDVFVGCRAHASVNKLTFHASGRCHKAFTNEYWAKKFRPNCERFDATWHRSPSPPAGEKRGSNGLAICFPTDYLSTSLSPDSVPDGTVWVPAATNGRATWIFLWFSRDDEQAVREAIAGSSQRLLLHHAIRPNEYALVLSGELDSGDNDVCFPAEPGGKHLIYTRADPFSTGRPMRVAIGPIIEDGQIPRIWELGGYAMPNNGLVDEAMLPYRRINRKVIRATIGSPGWRPKS